MTRFTRLLTCLFSLALVTATSCEGEPQDSGRGQPAPESAEGTGEQATPKLRPFSERKKLKKLGKLGRKKEAASPGATPTSPAENPGTTKAEPVPAATAAGKVLVGGPVYKHPMGYRFRYPQSWQLKEFEGEALVLIPGDVQRHGESLGELILAGGTSSAGAKDPADPRIVREAEQLMRQYFPVMKRDGEVVKGRHGGRPSATLSWKGENPQGGTYRARMWITILNDAAFAMTAVCPEESFPKRVPMIEAIFSSFHWQEPERDQALAGSWRHESTYFSGTFSATTVRYMQLRPDGTALWSSRALFGMSHHNSQGDFTGSSSGDSGDSDVSKGRWSAAGKRLYIVWESGSEEEWSYYLEGNSMLLKPIGGGKNKLWKRTR